MNNDNFLIESSDIEAIQELCGCIEDSSKRNLSVANALAAEIAKKYFTEIELDSVTTLHEIPQVLENIDIADIYIKNNYIDVRLYFEDENPSIPQSHFANGLNPLAYMFIKIDKDLSSATVTGFCITSEIDTDSANNGYILLSENDLVSYYDLENCLAFNDETDFDEDFEINIFNYLDNKLTNNAEFYNLLTQSPEARYRLKNAAKTKQVLKDLSIESFSNGPEIVSEAEKVANLEENETIDLQKDILPEEDILPEDPISELTDENDDFLLETDDADNILSEINMDDNEIAFESSETEELEFFEDLDNSENELLSMDEDIEQLDDFNTDDTETEDILELNNGEFDTEINNEEQDINQIDTGFIEEVVLEENEDPGLIENIETETEVLKEVENIEEIEDEATSEEKKEETFELLQAEDEIDNTDSIENIENEENNFEDASFEEMEELSEFSTNTTPSLASLEANDDNNEFNEEDLIKELNQQDDNILVENSDINNGEEKNSDEDDVLNNENTADIDALFNENSVDDSEDINTEEETVVNKKPAKKSPIKLIGMVAILIALGYFGYTKFSVSEQAQNDFNDTKLVTPVKNTNTKTVTKPVAMPNETVENVKNIKQTNEAVNETIPAIENNLDVPVNVSNLSIKWEVPSSYISSNSAKRYFTKLGKILQLNLKTELLLLNKQPLSNKISVELTFNKTNGKFETKGIIATSGEKSIDQVILNTVNNVLNININSNMSVFENIVGNPVLVIHL